MNDQEDNNLVPMQPDTEDPADLAVATGAPEEFGFPEKATLQQRECWRNQERFLDAFRGCCRISDASKAVGLTAWAVERWKRTDIYGFNKRLALAEREYLEKLEAEADRRAIDGIDHPVIHQGVITGTYKQYSDNLLMFRAKKLDPSYRDNYDNRSKENIPTVTQINIIMPPGVNDGKNLVIDGAARLVPDDEDTEPNGAETS